MTAGGVPNTQDDRISLQELCDSRGIQRQDGWPSAGGFSDLLGFVPQLNLRPWP